MDARIAAALAAAEDRFGAAAVARIARSTLTAFDDGGRAPQTPREEGSQRPTWIHTPGLSARPFWTRGACGRLDAVADALEEAFPALRDQLAVFHPSAAKAYDHLSLRDPVPGWKHFFFYRDHVGDEALLARAPALRRVVERFDRAHLDRFEIHLSILEPGAHIPPHCGGANLKLTLHLPLWVPAGDTALRVDSEVRGWREGEVLTFDDSFTHEAWNRTSEPRGVLLFTAYHPELSPDEIGVLSMLEPLNVEVYRTFLADRSAREQAPSAEQPRA